MADTLPPITNIEDDWVNVYSTIGESVGIPLFVQNTGATTLILRIQATKPDSDAQGIHLYPLDKEPVNAGSSGLWVRNSPKSAGLSRLQADVIGGIGDAASASALYPDSLQIQLGSAVKASNEKLWLLVTNNTTAAIGIDQVLALESFATGVNPGTSIESMLMIFNPDTTGATFLASDSKAYANTYSGDFVDITGTGIKFDLLENLNESLNTDLLRVGGGQVAFFESAQSLPTPSVNISVDFARPLSIPVGGSIIISFVNSPLVDGGCETITTASLAGAFLTFSGTVEIQPNNLITETGDNFITENGDNFVTEGG